MQARLLPPSASRLGFVLPLIKPRNPKGRARPVTSLVRQPVTELREATRGDDRLAATTRPAMVLEDCFRPEAEVRRATNRTSSDACVQCRRQVLFMLSSR